MDYEYSKTPPFSRSKWEIVPEVVSSASVPGKCVLKYRGIKEDVYVPFFRPDPKILNELNVSEEDLVVTVRPPATEAHYHNPESEKIFDELISWILSKPDTKIVLLPRNQNQNGLLRRRYRSWLENGRIVIPKQAVNGLNLLYFSDVVVSGGGTMNREAAALGIPVYSIFRGPLGAVDRHLEAEGRLIMISAAHEIRTKIKLCKRRRNGISQSSDRSALQEIIDHICFILAQESEIRH
jgi:predicted glycosyltransferase